VTRLALAVAIVFVACNRTDRLRGQQDGDVVERVVEPVVEAPATLDASVDPVDLTKLSGWRRTGEDPDGGCPQFIHPNYCSRRCKLLAERRGFPHATRVWPSAGVAFGTCGSYDVFSERSQDGGAITEYFDRDGGILVAATDNRQRCGRYGAIPGCTPKLVWDAGYVQRGLADVDPE
jgi:hypothetical protein